MVHNLNVTNSFQALAGIPGDDSVFSKSIGSVSSPFAPAIHSSPAGGPFPIGSDTASRTSNSHTHSSHHSASDNPVHKQGNFRTLVVNCNSVRGKPAELAHLLNYTDADAVLLCETKLDQSVNTAEFLPKHYCSVARKDRNTSGGGVMIALKTKFVAEEIEMTEKGGELVWAKIALANHHPMYIGSFYNNDGSTTNVEHLDHSLDQISDLTKNNPNALIAVGGDFNAGGVDWGKHIVTSEIRTAVLHSLTRSTSSALHNSRDLAPGRMQSWTCLPPISLA